MQTIKIPNKYKITKTKKELIKELDDLYEKNLKLEDELSNSKHNLETLNKTFDSFQLEEDELNKVLKTAKECQKEAKDILEEYDTRGYWKKHHWGSDRYKNIFSQMDALWHSNTYGTDTCSKCERYRDILSHAFDKVEEMSSRTLDDFSTEHKKETDKNLWCMKQIADAAEEELCELKEEIEQSRWINRIKELFKYRIRITKY